MYPHEQSTLNESPRAAGLAAFPHVLCRTIPRDYEHFRNSEKQLTLANRNTMNIMLPFSDVKNYRYRQLCWYVHFHMVVWIYIARLAR